jgi:hypothetical protein
MSMCSTNLPQNHYKTFMNFLVTPKAGANYEHVFSKQATKPCQKNRRVPLKLTRTPIYFEILFRIVRVARTIRARSPKKL